MRKLWAINYLTKKIGDEYFENDKIFKILKDEIKHHPNFFIYWNYFDLIARLSDDNKEYLLNQCIPNIGCSRSSNADHIAYIRKAKTQISEKQNSVNSYKIAMELAQARLDLKNAPPRDFEISAAQANIKRAEATLNRYLSDWSGTVITAPVDGIVTEINFDAGEQSSMARPVVAMIGLSTLQIEVDVPESDVTKLAVNDQVEISLDAFSSSEKFIGTVTFIDPAATIIDGVVYYTTKVALNEKDERIKSGMTADLTISTDSRENILVVPSRAVIYREDKKYLYYWLSFFCINYWCYAKVKISG
jgi:RND family efflux transporter MFP subunit